MRHRRHQLHLPALLCALLLPVPSGIAQEVQKTAGSEELALAERYLDALYSADLERLSDLSTEDLSFHDETSAIMPGGPWRREGRRAVFEFFRGSIETVDSSRFEIKSGFASGDQVVLHLDYVSSGDGAPFGAPGVPIDLRVDGVTVLELRDGRVAKHQDNVDYQSALDQIAEQVERHALIEEAKAASMNSGDARPPDAGPTPMPRFPRPDPEEVAALRALAERYLDAVWSLDYDTMERLLADDALYEDYTVEYFGGPPYRFEGRNAVVDFFRTANADSGTRSIEPEIREIFVAGPNVVVLVDVTATVDGASWGVPGRELVGSGLTISWLHIRHGAIARHMDLADFDDAIRGFEESAAGSAPNL